MRIRTVLAVFSVLAVIAVVGVLLVMRHIGGGIPLLSSSCTAKANGEVTLDPEQMANAATIAAVGMRRGVPDRAVVIALAAAAQESKLRNLGGGDRDSVGLFQQRPSQGWGTAEQIADPRYAAGQFYSALLRMRDWQGLDVGDAAQRVQHSAYPEAYDHWVDQSQTLASAFSGRTGGALACTLTDPPTRTGEAAAVALQHDLTLDWGRVTTVRDTASVQVPVRSTQTGWRYAHWLVAHAADQGIRSVRFGDQQWTATAGDWSGASPAANAGTDRVIADVYANR
ncbi:MAG: hypothetical protein J2P15_15495 [Micromonosporaceae bacterium]|nr:hypothetical protein [Micromonosporaceae bacterium]